MEIKKNSTTIPPFSLVLKGELATQPLTLNNNWDIVTEVMEPYKGSAKKKKKKNTFQEVKDQDDL